MVDVSAKDITLREARAEALLEMRAETLEAILAGNLKKGDVFSTARLAGVMGAKKTSDLIPLCHPLPLSHIVIAFEPQNKTQSQKACLAVRSLVRAEAKTGVEMEALTAAALAALTIYDMAKSLEKTICVKSLRLLSKSGGKSGDFKADG